MNTLPEISAAAAGDAYTNRPRSDVDNSKRISLGGHEYRVFGYKDDPITGFHATAYRSKETGDIIIAYRGTDPGHPITTVQDAIVDATMVRDRVNPQEAAASAFTHEMIGTAERQGIAKNRITVAGHSLGGTLAEIEAARFGLGGSTYNAYGAADLGYNLPDSGSKVTNYVMAGDVVSAASHHNGHVVTLASPDDLKGMHAGRYLDAPDGAQPSNPFLAMSLGDHSITHFTGPDSVLKPETLAQYEKNYTDHKAAVDAYRNDVRRERGELSEALRQAQGHEARVQLPPDLRKQLDEYLTVNVDPAIREKIEQNSVVLSVEHGLQTGADTLRAGGQYVQSQSERVATAAHAAGNAMGPINPVASLAGTVAWEAAHLHGQAANAMGNLAANGLHAAKQAIEHGTHGAAQTVNAAIHSPAIQAGAIHLVNGAVDTYQAVENAGHAVEQTHDHAKQAVSHDVDIAKHTAMKAYDETRQAVSHGIDVAGHAATEAYDHTSQAVSHGIDVARHNAAQAYDNTRQAASHGVDAVEHAAGKAYDTLTHPGQWLGSTPSSSAQPQHGRANPIAESPYTRDDPRHVANPNHALYQELHERIPAASEKRLLQFTAACHNGGITHRNIGPIAYDESRGIMHFMTALELRPPVAVDVKMPSPDWQHSIHQIQRTNQLQAHIHEQSQAHGAQIGQ